MEKRRFTRVPFRTLGRLSTPAGEAAGEVLNISLKGLLLESAVALPVGAGGDVEITLEGATPEIRLVIASRVVRAAERELAIEFELQGIDVDALTHLRAIVSYNTGEGEQVLTELIEYLDHRAESPKA